MNKFVFLVEYALFPLQHYTTARCGGEFLMHLLRQSGRMLLPIAQLLFSLPASNGKL